MARRRTKRSKIGKLDPVNSCPLSDQRSAGQKKLKNQECTRVELYFENEFDDLFRMEIIPRDQEAHDALLRYYKRMGKKPK